MQETLPVSVVVIAKNEEKRLAECLASVSGWAGEILVVDDESTDQTVEVAKRFGARVIVRRMDVEGRHRNFAHAQARFDWIFSIDADERSTPELSAEIRGLFLGDPPCDIYAVPRRNYIGKKWLRYGGWYPSAQVKLFHRLVFQWEETTVHPRALSTSSKPWGALRGDLIHLSYRDFSDFIAKMNRQTTLEAMKWVQDGRRMTFFKAMWRGIDRFVRSFVFKKGYRDGFVGYFASVCAGFYQFLSFAKFWNLQNPPPSRAPAGSPPRPPEGPAHRPAHKSFSLSAVILTKNAMVTFPACLQSVRWVDEVVVVDGGSTDGTVELARAAGAAVVHEPTLDDFGYLRNQGTRAASGDWVLQLDADEVVTPAFQGALCAILTDSPSVAAYKFRRQNIFLGRLMRYGGWDHHSLHLFRRGLARYEGRVHEKLHVDGRIGILPVGVEHTPFRSMEEYVERQNRYTTLEARDLIEKEGRALLRRVRGQTSWKPLKLFWKSFVKKQGFREGGIGFIFAGLDSYVYFLKWAKAWEIFDAA